MCGSSSSPTTITITISATTANPFPPTITDGVHRTSTESDDTNLVTGVHVGNIVVFQKAGDISSITAITETSGNVFSTDPTLQSDGTWKGVIGNLAVNTEETYSITYTVNGVSGSFTQDPKIQINP